MALQSSGSISLSQINTELGRSSNAQIGVNLAENGSYATINKCSPLRPFAPNPARFSEWYSYNHSATCNNCWNGSNELTFNFTTKADNASASLDSRFNPVFIANTLGNFNAKLWIDSISSGNLNLYITVFALDSNKENPVFLGYYDVPNKTTGSYTLTSMGTNTSTSGYIVFYIEIGSTLLTGVTVTGQIRFSMTCPSMAICGSSNAVSVVSEECFCGDVSGTGDFAGQSYPRTGVGIWFEVGTSNRSVTITYTAPNPSGLAGPPVLYVKDGAGNVLVNGVNVTWGTNQTYTFSFTYTTSPYIRCEIRTDCWC